MTYYLAIYVIVSLICIAILGLMIDAAEFDEHNQYGD